MEAHNILALIFGSLGIVAWYMIREWKRTWEDRVIAHDQRLDIHTIKHGEQDVTNATIIANMEHIKETGDETRKDVKELLKISNGQSKRSAG